MTLEQLIGVCLSLVVLVGSICIIYATMLRDTEKWYVCKRCGDWWSDHGNRSKTWPHNISYHGQAVCDECRHPIDWSKEEFK